MAIRNIELGGASDWSDGQVLDDDDLNDTFDAVSDRSQSLSAFWLNTDLYAVWDDFEDETLGTYTTDTEWTITITTAGATATGTADIIVGTINAGGKELRLSATGDPS